MSSELAERYAMVQIGKHDISSVKQINGWLLDKYGLTTIREHTVMTTVKQIRLVVMRRSTFQKVTSHLCLCDDAMVVLCMLNNMQLLMWASGSIWVDLLLHYGLDFVFFKHIQTNWFLKYCANKIHLSPWLLTSLINLWIVIIILPFLKFTPWSLFRKQMLQATSC